MGYDASTLAQTTVLNLTPNGNEGAIWGSGAGMAAEGNGNIFLLDSNGDFDTNLNSAGFPRDGDFRNAFLKLSTKGGLAVADYFEMDNEQQENNSDTDLGSGGALLLPPMKDSSGKIWQLASGAGKDSNLYIVNCNSMGKFNPNGNNIYQDCGSSARWNLVHASFFCRLTLGPWVRLSWLLSSRTRNCYPLQLPRPVIALGTRELFPASPPTTARTVLSGPPRTPTLRFYPHTMPRTYRSYTTATRRRTGAITLRPQQIHHPDDCPRQSLCGHDERCRCIRIVIGAKRAPAGVSQISSGR